MRLSTLFLPCVSILSSIASTSACGYFDYFGWEELPDEVQEAALGLGYTEETWTNLQTNPIEFVAFDDILDGIREEMTPIGLWKANTTDILAAMKTLDLYDEKDEDPEVCWDFKVNHYDGYSWEETGESENPFGDNIQELLKILGWNEEMWDDDDGMIPETECMGWLEMGPEERWALRSLGWNAILWLNAPADPRCAALRTNGP